MTEVPTVLHDGEDFVLHYHPGSADYLLITFVATHQERFAKESYLLRDMVELYDLPCLGIACKTRNFYVSGEMDRVIEAAAPIVKQFKTVVAIGNSIGGYGAIKFSRRFGATHVLAMSPAFSVDPEEPLFDDPHEQARLKNDLVGHGITSFEEFKGTAIRPEDVSGRIFVLHNPLRPIDAYQMKHLRQAIELEEISLPQGAHDVFQSISQPESMFKIVTLLRTTGPAMLRREFRAIKRTIPGSFTPMLKLAIIRHPLLVHRVLRGKHVSGNPALRELDHGRLSTELAYRLAVFGQEADAFERIETLIRERLGKPVRIAADQKPGHTGVLQPGRRYLLMSSHGAFLSAAKPGSRLTLCSDPFATNGIRPVFVSVLPDGLVLQTVSHTGEASEPLVVNEKETRLDWAPSGGRVTLRTQAGFITALPHDVLRYAGEKATDWEKFLPIAVSDPATLIQRRANDWLEAVSTRMDGTPAQAKAAQPAQSSGSGWSRLFKFAARAR